MKRAFTLIESLIVVAISVSVMITIALLIYSFNKTSGYGQMFAQSSGSASAILREVESLAFPADAVLATHTFAGATYTSTSTSLVLEIPSINGSGNVIANIYDYAVFYVVGTTTAYRLLEAHPFSHRTSGTKQLSSTVNALTFSYNDADFTKVSTVTVDIQTQALVREDIVSDHRREQIRLRNY
jgi:hypothetical protein